MITFWVSVVGVPEYQCADAVIDVLSFMIVSSVASALYSVFDASGSILYARSGLSDGDGRGVNWRPTLPQVNT